MLEAVLVSPFTDKGNRFKEIPRFYLLASRDQFEIPINGI